MPQHFLTHIHSHNTLFLMFNFNFAFEIKLSKLMFSTTEEEEQIANPVFGR